LIELVTVGETMISFTPQTSDAIRYGTTYSMRIAGAESNTAIGVQHLGHNTGWISRLSQDDFGHYILRMIRAEGVDTSNIIIDKQHSSGLMFKNISHCGETSVLYYRGDSATTFLHPSDLSSDYIAQAKILHLTGITPILSESCYTTLKKAAEIAKSANTLISFDPNIRRKLWHGVDYTSTILEFIELSDIVLLGLDEAFQLYTTNDYKEIMDTVFSSTTVKYLAIKDGKNGAWVADRKASFFIPPKSCNPVDSIGAGDAFNAGFLSGLLDDLDLETCGKMGGIAGACATETKGDIEGYPDKIQMNNILNNLATTQR